MSFRVFLLLIVLLPAAWLHAATAPRVGEAQVRETKGGLPCFTISEREEERAGAPNFQAVTVYDPAARPRAKMWAMAMPPDRTFPVLFSMCIPYAGRVQALPQTKAAVLQTGRVYEVYIDVRPGGGPSQPRGYGARFCLAKQRDGSVMVRHIGADAHEGHNLYGCAAPR
ncbi:MAG: hypothetical protein JWQ01_1241 [Massilia sp.]|nr:hypothetical protein [Massilia sp.]